MFYYYGGKRRLAARYQEPRFDTIVEPFAGAAGYALLHRAKNVVLIEKDPRIVALWRWLIAAQPSDILALPLYSTGERVKETGEAGDLIRSFAAPGARTGTIAGQFSKWNWKKRAEIAALVPEVKHWTVIEGDYTDAPDMEATWFVDPPYQFGGHQYRFSNEGLDYAALLEWCERRQGQIIVCEDDRNGWLPQSRPLAMNKNIQNREHRREVVYERGCTEMELSA